VHVSFAAPAKYTVEGDQDATILRWVLDIRLREVLREDMGGVYGVSVQSQIAREPMQRQYLGIGFGCAPDNIDKLRAATFAELASIAASGVGADVLAKISAQLLRQHETELADNSWWAGALVEWAKYGTDLASMIAIDRFVARVTSANVQATAKRMFDPSRYIVVTLVPTASPRPVLPSSPPASSGRVPSAPGSTPLPSPAASPPGSTTSNRDSASPPP
jgi:zinc protease